MRLRLANADERARYREKAVANSTEIPRRSFFSTSTTEIQFPDSAESDLLAWGWSERLSAMIRTLEFVVPTGLAVALAIVLSIGAIYLTEIFLGPIEQVEAHQPGGRP